MVRTGSVFQGQAWQVLRLTRHTQPDQIWRVKAARVWLSSADGLSVDTYWLIWASNDATGEEKYFLSNAPADTPVEKLVRVAFVRWRVEHCFRIAKSELGFTHFEGRSYVALMRHQLLCLASLSFAAAQAAAARGEKSGDHGGTALPGAGGADAAVVGSTTGYQ